MSWKIDPGKSHIVFTVRHLMITKVHGKMKRFSGSIDFNLEDPVNSSVRAEVDPASVDTRLSIRDANVRAVLLKVKKHPKITYQSTHIEVVDDSHGLIYGDLTIHGIAKQVVLDTEYHGLSQNPDGLETAAFSATTRLNRKDWGLKWMPLLEIGGLFVRDQFDVEIQVVAVKENEAAAKHAQPMQSEVMPAQD